jgi:hypothetical protein
MVAWVWFAVAAGFGLVCAWEAMAGQIDWTLDDAAVIAAMGCTSNNTFLLWKRPVAGSASAARDG